MMSAPKMPTTAKPAADLATTALANVEGLQELPQFEADDRAGLIDFSLLGDTEAAAHSVA
jgi:hypothetical protein